MLTRRVAQLVSIGSLVGLSACVATAPSVPAAREPVRVSNGGQPFQMWEGAAARKAADAQCGAKGVRVSIYDRFDRATGQWVYPEGCA
jgi:hypothetical protein